MGYQALLFCPDEKLARVITQVFNDLDFAVDPVQEPFAAVKQLMAQRYDAVVVDCDNDQNASLLFRSARNSSFNQSSLAFALVEGQTGVAKAYRIGANLVLTKPINVEQAKGTLRIARGLLRKNSEPVSAGAAAGAGPASSASPSSSSTSAVTSAVGPAATHHVEVGASSSLTATNTAVIDIDIDKVNDKLNAVHARASQNYPVVASPAREEERAVAATKVSVVQKDTVDSGAPQKLNKSASIDPAASDPAAPPQEQKSVGIASSTGSAAAASPAKDSVAQPAKEKEDKAVDAKPARASSNPAPVAAPLPILGSINTSNSPSFGGLNTEVSEADGRKKKFLIAAVIVLFLAAITYFADAKYDIFGTRRAPEQSPGQPQQSSQPAPAVRPMSYAPAASSDTSDAASAANRSAGRQPATPKVINPEEITIGGGDDGDNAVPVNKRRATPILVNSHNSRARFEAVAEESAAQPPTLSVASASSNDTKLNGLMSSASLEVSKPELATLKVSQGVSQGLLIKRVEPKYPAAALAIHAHGSVQIEATINKDGSVVNPKVIRGDALLARAALEAVRQWRYKPYYLDGSPVEIHTQITINFKAN